MGNTSFVNVCQRVISTSKWLTKWLSPWYQDTFGAVCGALRGGGVLLLSAPPLDEWKRSAMGCLEMAG